MKETTCEFNCHCHKGMLGTEIYGDNCGICGCSVSPHQQSVQEEIVKEKLGEILCREKSSIYWQSSPVEYHRMIEVVSSLLSQSIKETEARVLREMQNIVLNNSSEEYEHVGKSFLVANTDRIMFAILAYAKEKGISLEANTESK